MLRPPPGPTLFPYTSLFRSPACPGRLRQREVLVPHGRSQDVREALRILRQRSEEHTSELQSRGHLVCRLLLEKKNRKLLREGGDGCADTRQRLSRHQQA